MFSATKPGGWIEDLEMSIQFKSDDGTVGDDHFMTHWSKTFIDASEMIGKSFNVIERQKELITQVGFIDVHEKKYKLPVGEWSSDPKLKELGQWDLLFCLQGLEGWALFLLTEVLKVSISIPLSPRLLESCILAPWHSTSAKNS
jgi:hypothetical protein